MGVLESEDILESEDSPAYSEGKLLGYGYDFEQATKAIVMPKFAPALPSNKLSY